MNAPLLTWTTTGGTTVSARGNVEYRIASQRHWFTRRFSAAAWEDGIPVHLGADLASVAVATACCDAEVRVRDDSPPMQLLRRLQLQATSGTLEPMREQLLPQWGLRTHDVSTIVWYRL
jgi:hypothetical protein